MPSGALVKASVNYLWRNPSSQSSNNAHSYFAKKNEHLIVKISQGYKAPADKTDFRNRPIDTLEILENLAKWLDKLP